MLRLHGLYDSIMSAMRWSDMLVSHVDTWLMRLGEFEIQRSRILSFRVGSKMYWLRRWSAMKSMKVSGSLQCTGVQLDFDLVVYNHWILSGLQ